MEKLKKVLFLIFLFVVMLSLIPVGSLVFLDRRDAPVSALVSQSRLSMASRNQPTVTVILPETGERKVMSEPDYLCGVVASQMPAEYDDEAIKAQAVASYTVLKYRRLHGTPSDTQSFMTKKQMKKKWGKNYQKNYSRIQALVNSVYGETVTYDGEPILAAYHELSCGVTEYGCNVWEGEYPYLVPVESRDDLCAENYRSTVKLTETEFSAICSKMLGVVPAGSPSEWVGECIRTDSGYVMSYTICGSKCNGQKLRNVFGLRSACFSLKYEDKAFVFDVRGIGHGVGMSKFGANLMALNGKTYRDILAHYYKGTHVI